jgi:cytochrome c oxidase subunit 2
MMNFEVRAVSPEDFKAYLDFREKNPQASNADALKSIGQDPYATSTRPFLPGRDATRGVDGENYIAPSAA